MADCDTELLYNPLPWPLSSVVRQATHNRLVAGSSPAGATRHRKADEKSSAFFFLYIRYFACRKPPRVPAVGHTVPLQSDGLILNDFAFAGYPDEVIIGRDFICARRASTACSSCASHSILNHQGARDNPDRRYPAR